MQGAAAWEDALRWTEPMAHRALRSFITLPLTVRLLWFLATFIALNIMLRLVA